MKPYCDRPLCTRQFDHEHPAEAPDQPPGASESDAGAIPARHTPPNGTEAQERSAQEVGKDLVKRAREMRKAHEPGTSAPAEPRKAAAGASPEVETGDAADGSAWAELWEGLTRKLERAEEDAATLRNRRVKLLAAMKAEGMTLADIAAVTGISRQRVGQLLR